MATFQKRNGRVTATVRIKSHPAKSKTFDTLRDAKAWAKETEVQFKNENELIFDHVIFKDAFIEYRDTVRAKSKNSKREISRCNFILKNMDMNIPLSKVDRAFLVDWREKRLESVTPATVRREFIMLAGFFTWCVEVKLWLQVSPIKEVKFPKDSDHREKIISDQEIETLLPFLDEELKTIFLLALETGMRQSEICLLTWDRVRLSQKYLFLETSKNGRPREIPLSKKAISLLESRIGVDSKKVFNYLAEYASVAFYKARLEAGLTDFTFHDSRHTAATKIALKIQLLDLCKMFGWSDPKRAMVYYNPTASEIAERL